MKPYFLLYLNKEYWDKWQNLSKRERTTIKENVKKIVCLLIDTYTKGEQNE